MNYLIGPILTRTREKKILKIPGEKKKKFFSNKKKRFFLFFIPEFFSSKNHLFIFFSQNRGFFQEIYIFNFSERNFLGNNEIEIRQNRILKCRCEIRNFQDKIFRFSRFYVMVRKVYGSLIRNLRKT